MTKSVKIVYDEHAGPACPGWIVRFRDTTHPGEIHNQICPLATTDPNEKVSHLHNLAMSKAPLAFLLEWRTLEITIQRRKENDNDIDIE